MPRPFEKGKRGKKKGSVNKFTKSVKECFETVFSEIQSHPTAKLSEWAKKNPTEFYKLCARLIPAAVDVTSNGETFTSPNIILNK